MRTQVACKDQSLLLVALILFYKVRHELASGRRLILF